MLTAQSQGSISRNAYDLNTPSQRQHETDRHHDSLRRMAGWGKEVCFLFFIAVNIGCDFILIRCSKRTACFQTEWILWCLVKKKATSCTGFRLSNYPLCIYGNNLKCSGSVPTMWSCPDKTQVFSRGWNLKKKKCTHSFIRLQEHKTLALHCPD